MRTALLTVFGILVFVAQAGAQVEQVTIAGRAVDDPGAYRELLERGEPAEPAPRDAQHVEIVIQPSGFSGPRRLDYFPLEEVVQSNGDWVSVSDGLAEQIEDELAEQATEGRSSWPAYLTLFALLAAGGTVAWLMWGRRRWRARAT